MKARRDNTSHGGEQEACRFGSEHFSRTLEVRAVKRRGAKVKVDDKIIGAVSFIKEGTTSSCRLAKEWVLGCNKDRSSASVRRKLDEMCRPWFLQANVVRGNKVLTILTGCCAGLCRWNLFGHVVSVKLQSRVLSLHVRLGMPRHKVIPLGSNT